MTERDRIRAKLDKRDRAFLDELRKLFPSARMVWLEFSDGETVGRTSNEMPFR